MHLKTISLVPILFAAGVGLAQGAEANYTCDGGTRLMAVFSDPSVQPGSVVLHMSGAGEITLPQVMSADGGRYADDKMEFWIKGNEATLTRDGASQTCHTK